MRPEHWLALRMGALSCLYLLLVVKAMWTR